MPQVARSLPIGQMTRVRFQVAGGYFISVLRVQTGSGTHSAFCVPGLLWGQWQQSLGLATLPLPSAMAVNMWTLASTSPVGLHGL